LNSFNSRLPIIDSQTGCDGTSFVYLRVPRGHLLENLKTTKGTKLHEVLKTGGSSSVILRKRRNLVS
jgi:hypothetical protein